MKYVTVNSRCAVAIWGFDDGCESTLFNNDCCASKYHSQPCFTPVKGVIGGSVENCLRAFWLRIALFRLSHVELANYRIQYNRDVRGGPECHSMNFLRFTDK